ncbi:putative G antigen family E member 3 [Myotis myotis]|uniref:putative G antigen family E member 3 n=1 Tax=Myotis myotis TaxID=51298 RepID=UPI00174DC4BB|nr:putative G antigen family E member 3 [Myotis myotis]
MSEQAKSASTPEEGGNDQEFSHLVEPIADTQPSDEQLQQEEPQIENQDIIPSQEPEDARVSEVQGPVLEAEQQELTLEDTRDQCGDGPDVMEHILSNLEPIIVPEAGEGQPYL